MSRHVDLAVVDHDRVRRDTGKTSRRLLVGCDEHPGRDAGVGQDPTTGPRRRIGGDRLVEHERRVDGLRRHRRQPQRDDRPAAQIKHDCQLQTHPPQRDRVHREHVESRGVQQQVLAGARRDELAVWGGRAVGDAALGLRTTSEGVRSTRDLRQSAFGLPALGHGISAVVLGHAGVDAVQQQSLGRSARADMLGEHPSQLVQPARIDPAQRPGRAYLAPVDQPGLTIALKRGDPSTQGADADAQLTALAW